MCSVDFNPGAVSLLFFPIAAGNKDLLFCFFPRSCPVAKLRRRLSSYIGLAKGMGLRCRP